MNDKTGKKCYMYLRVSTDIQVDGYSLDAQRNQILRYVDTNGMIVSGVYRDKGKSGKNIEGRPEFQRMMEDIKNNKDNVAYVIVFKLSRFGRSARDILNTMQDIKDCGVELISVDEKIDSTTNMGRMMITFLSMMAEIERENILIQSMAGRLQKAKLGRWNGGIAPYGYNVGEDGVLVINQEAAEVVKMIFSEYAYTGKGPKKIAKELNQRGIKKEVHTEYNVDYFQNSFIKRVLTNPVYLGQMVYGRLTNTKVKGTDQYKRVKSDDYMVVENAHKAIIDRKTWDIVQKRLAEDSSCYHERTFTKNEYLLTGLIKCPVCGGNLNTNGSNKSEYHYYTCRKRTELLEQKCPYTRQVRREKIEKEVEDTIFALVHDKDFAGMIKEKIGTEIDTTEIDKLISDYEKQLQKINNNIHRWEDKLNELDIEDKHYDKRVESYENQITKLYDQVDEVESKIQESKERRRGIEMQAITADNVYKYLLYFDELYSKMTFDEKKAFLRSFIEAVHIYPEKRGDGKVLKSIDFKFPIYFNGNEGTSLFLDNGNARGHERVQARLSTK